ncbi:hypothetical protein AN958_05523 [Leucoagaricus sp. SymC.cos]|nr:hypothetical protein AN958_05523 [Leucoagaricus sp. SymC.cos]
MHPIILTTMTDQELKLPLPQFLKIMTNNGIPAANAMALTGKIYKVYNTPPQLNKLADSKLVAAGVSDKEDRKLVLAAFRKAGYLHKGKAVTKKEAIEKNITSSPGAGPSNLASTAMELLSASSAPKRKRKHTSDKNEFLPDAPSDAPPREHTRSLEFNEILDEEQLRNKSCVINRAPIMTAWSMVVAERLGFKRDEALSIASVYTEMNAISKGVSLGIFKESREKGMGVSSKGTQPYVVIMGRNPLYQTQEGQWRALSDGSPIFPGTAFDYISRSFKQTAPFILGALQLLARSYPPKTLNMQGWSLYADFRPQTEGWGKRSEVKCDVILGLRLKTNTIPPNQQREEPSPSTKSLVKVGLHDDSASSVQHDEPSKKKARTMTLEEYEANLDNDTTFDDVNLDFADPSRK